MLLNKIVVAEDDDAIAHMVNMALGDAGFLCMRARDGAEALHLVRVHAPDLLVLDVMMPKVDGHEVARKLKADVILSKIPILMLTALEDVDSKVAGFDAGADDYLSKPFDLREFGARVRALLRQTRRERDRNPITDLPGAAAVDEQVEAVLGGQREAAFVHVGVVGFDDYADRVGYARAQELVAALGRCALSETRRAGSGFVGHLGGVDFVAVVEPAAAEELARSMRAAFAEHRAEWAGEDAGELSLVAGIANAAGASDAAELAKRLAAALRAAKRAQGAGHVVWGPEVG